MIIDAKKQVLGRLASYAAKKALLGEEVIVINAEKALVSGKREAVIGDNLKKLEIRNLGNPRRGPFYQKRPDRYVRRVIRGMLPYKKGRGREAYARVMVYVGFPEQEIKKKHKLDKVEVMRLKGTQKILKDYVTVGEVCKSVGGKW